MKTLTGSSVTRFENDTFQWFVLRDLKRSNAKNPAYKLLRELNFEVFTPMTWKLVNLKGKQTPQEVPVIPSLLFVKTSKTCLDEVVSKISTLQYCYVRGNGHVPMVVDDHEMSRFIHAVKTSKSPRFYSPDELTPSMAGKMVRIVGGSLDGYEGRLQKMQGSGVKRLFVEIPGLFAVAVEVQSEYIQVLPPLRLGGSDTKKVVKINEKISVLQIDFDHLFNGRDIACSYVMVGRCSKLA